MDIRSIAQNIRNVLNQIRPPAIVIPGILLVCSMIKRPGLSVMVSVANIISKMEAREIPMTDDMCALVEETVTELYRALRNDANIQIGIKPGSILITATGANAGGSMTVIGNNINAPNGVGFLQ